MIISITPYTWEQFNAIIIDQFNAVASAEAAKVLEKIGKEIDPLIRALEDENIRK